MTQLFGLLSPEVARLLESPYQVTGAGVVGGARCLLITWKAAGVGPAGWGTGGDRV